jgi:hypothetical protein
MEGQAKREESPYSYEANCTPARRDHRGHAIRRFDRFAETGSEPEVTMSIARILFLSCALWLCVGCSAFRWGERSYQEVEELNQQQREAERVMFKNDEVLSEK